MFNKSIIAVTLLLIPTPALANEIAGSRVIGQGAVCAEGQGKGIDYNIATKTETSYCFELPTVVAPTPIVTPTPVVSTSDTATVTSSVPTPVVTETTTTTRVRPAPQPPQLDIATFRIDVVVDVTTHTVVEKKRTVEEIVALWAIDFDRWFSEWIAYMTELYSW